MANDGHGKCQTSAAYEGIDENRCKIIDRYSITEIIIPL